MSSILSLGPIDYGRIKQVLDDTFLRFVDKTMITNPRFFYKVYEGKGFTVSHRFTGVASGASVDFYFENPSGSGVDVFMIAVEVTALASCHIDIYRNNSISSAGTMVTPVNLNFSSTNTSVVQAEYGGTYTLGNLVKQTICPGGSKKEAIGGLASIGENVVIPPGNNFVIRTTNVSAASTDIAVEILWWEE